MSSAQVEATLGQIDNRPLTPKEYALLQRLLSDPFSIPAPFKAWLVSYLETSDMTLTMGAVEGLAGAVSGPSVLGGLVNVTTDVNGFYHVSFPSPVRAVKSIVLTNSGGINFAATHTLWAFNLTGFDVRVWNVPVNNYLPSTAVQVTWQALVTP